MHVGYAQDVTSIIGWSWRVLQEGRLANERGVLQAWGEVIRRYRQWKRLSRRDLALKAGISPVFLGEIERGEKDPSSHSLCLITAALDVPLAELYLRVATKLEVPPSNGDLRGQTSLPLGVSEATEDYLEGVSPASDETAFDLYKIVRLLRSDQQVSLLILARSLADERK
jgi:transcriptional regulator with XRE-family HTH domain